MYIYLSLSNLDNLCVCVYMKTPLPKKILDEHTLNSAKQYIQYKTNPFLCFHYSRPNKSRIR